MPTLHISTRKSTLHPHTTLFRAFYCHPGAAAAHLTGAPRFVHGLATATATGACRAPIANCAVLNPGSLLDAKGELGGAQGGAGIGPDITVEGFPLTDGIVIGPENGETGRMGAVNGVVGLLNNLLGGAR